MSQQEFQVKIPLNAGINTTSANVPEAVQAGELLVSKNTRLSVPFYKGTVVRAPAASTLLSSPADYSGLHGILPLGEQQTDLLCYRPLQGNKIASEAAVETSPSTAFAATRDQAAHVMLEIERAGQAISGFMHSAPAICATDDHVWYASIVAEGRHLNLYVSVETHDGTSVVARKFVQRVVSNYITSDIVGQGQWCALTEVGGVMYVWYKVNNPFNPYYAFLSLAISARTLTLGALQLVAGGATHWGTQRPDICTDGTSAFLVTAGLASGPNSTTRVYKINPAANTYTSVDIASFDAAIDFSHVLACSYVSAPSTRVLLACGTGSSSGRMASIDPATLAVQWNVTTGFAAATATRGLVSVGVLVRGGSAYAVGAFSDVDGVTGVGGSPYPITNVTFRNLASGTFFDTQVFPWMAIQGPMATWQARDTEQYPLLPLMRILGTPSLTPTEEMTVEDPAVSLLLLGDATSGSFSVVARYGVDQIYQPYFSLLMNSFPSTTVRSDRFFSGYLLDRGVSRIIVAAQGGRIDFETGFPARSVAISLASGPRRSASDSSGVAMSGSAAPVCWDGKELTEAGWLHKPRIAVTETGGTGADWTGEYAFRAVYVSRNATGAIVRSAPSLPVTITPTGEKPRLWVQQAFTARDGQRVSPFNVEVYVLTITDSLGNPGDGLYYLQNPPLASTTADGCYTFTALPEPAQGTSVLYSDGGANQELLPVAPPPARDVTFIGSRMWALDAEGNGRIWPSKLKQPGIAVEFSSELVIELDGSVGGLVGICEYDGEPLIFAQRGIYRVAGEGPNNNLSAGGFAAPRLVAAIGCSDKHSIVRFPYGVMFASTEGTFASLTANGLKRYDTIYTQSRVTGAVVLPESKEIVYSLSGVADLLVYNWEFDRWTTWTARAGGYSSFALSGSSILAVGALDGTVVRYDLDSFSRFGQEYRTGWAMPAQDDQADCQIRELVLQAFSRGPHGVEITANFDYKTGTGYTQTRTFSASEISALAAQDPSSRYTLRWKLPVPNCRAVQLSVVETEVPSGGTEPGFSPLSLTLAVGLDAGFKRRAVGAGALK